MNGINWIKKKNEIKIILDLPLPFKKHWFRYQKVKKQDHATKKYIKRKALLLENKIKLSINKQHYS